MQPDIRGQFKKALLHFHETAYADYHLYQCPDHKSAFSLLELSLEDTASILDDNEWKRWRAYRPPPSSHIVHDRAKRSAT